MPLRNKRNCYWYWIDKRFIEHYAKEVGVFGVAVYNVLAFRANKQQACWPSQKGVAEALGCSRASVSRAMKKLEKAGLVKIVRISRYDLVYNLIECVAQETQVDLTETQV